MSLMNFFVGSPWRFVSGIGDGKSPRSTTTRPMAAICSRNPAMRNADGPMSTPRRLPPISSGTPIKWTGEGTGYNTKKASGIRPMRIPDIKVPPPGPRAMEMIARDAAVVSPSYPRSAPFGMARGQGCVVEDVDGNVYLDFSAGIAVAATGHSHPDVVRAITEQAAKFLHISTDFYHEPQVALGELLASIAPMGDRARTFF